MRLLALLLLFSISGVAQTHFPVLGYINYTQADGLAADYVTSVAQDSTGFIWIGTNNGLSRFDGYRFQNFHHDPSDSNSLSNNAIARLAVDGQNRLWIATKLNGVSCLDLSTYTFKRFLPGVQRLRDLEIVGRQLFVAAEEGLYQVDLDRLTVKNITFTPTKTEQAAGASTAFLGISRSKGQDEYLWLPSGTCFYQYHIPSGNYVVHAPADEHGNRFHGSNELLFRGDRIFALTAAHGVIEWTIGRPTFKRHIYNTTAGFWTNHLHDGTWYNNHQLLLCSHDHGLIFLDIDKVEFEVIQPETNRPNGLLPGSVFDFFKDRQGNYWLGTVNGLSHLPRRSAFFERFDVRFAIPTEWDFTIPQDYLKLRDGRLLITLNKSPGKLILFDPLDNSMKAVPMIGAVPWLTDKLLRTRDGRILVSGAGLFEFNPETGQAIRVPLINKAGVSYDQEIIATLLQGEDGKIWMNGWHRGFYCYDPSTGYTQAWYANKNNTNGPLSNFRSTTIYEDQYGRIWSGHSHGVNIYWPERDTFINLTSAIGLRGDLIYSIEEAKDGTIWIGSRGGGLTIATLNGPENISFRHLGQSDGLISDQITAIVRDLKGRMWCYTENGLSMVMPGTFDITNFYPEDGIPPSYHRPGHFLDTSDGYIYLGHASAFHRFHPDSLINLTPDPKLIIHGTWVNGTTASDEILSELTYYQNNIQVDFAALDFIFNRQMKYQYRLTGLDDNWHTAANGSVSFSNLRPGDYTLELRAGGITGNEWYAQKTVPFSIAKAWYMRTGVWILAAFLALAVIILIIQIRIKITRREERLKAEFSKHLMEAELGALRSQMNPHFIFNSLNSIKYFIIQNQKELAADYLTKFSQLIRLILQNSKNEWVPFQADLEALKLYIELEQIRLNNQFEVNWDIDPSISQETTLIPPLSIQPFVENAIWHGLKHRESNGLLDISVQQQNGHLEVRVKDNGIGREAAKKMSGKKHRSFGLQITAQRLRELSKGLGDAGFEIHDLKDESENPAGTEVNIKLKTKAG